MFASGFSVGILGGLIGLSGAEFRLPILIAVFGFQALPAAILNKATSLVVVAASLPLRSSAVPIEDVLQQWEVIVTLLAGSLLGAWFGAGWATRINSSMLHRVLAVLLLVMAGLLIWGHGARFEEALRLTGVQLFAVGFCDRFWDWRCRFADGCRWR